MMTSPAIIIAHVLEIIVSCVVLADMVEAKAEILPFAQPAHGRTEFTGRRAAGMIATDVNRPGLRCPLDPDSREDWGVEIHAANIRSETTTPQGAVAKCRSLART